MRYACPSALVCVVLAGVTTHAQLFGDSRDLNRRGDAVSRLQFWVDAVQSHRAGAPDEATRRIARWTWEELEDLTLDLRSVLKLIDNPRAEVFSVWVEDGRRSGDRRVVYTRSERERLRRIASTAARNQLLKRGAAMHTTIAINRPDPTETRTANPFVTKFEGVVRFTDGRQLGLDRRANHWKFVRGLLDLVTPHPSRDDAVREWYRASSAVLLGRLHLHDDHFEQAVRLFPDDPLLLMFAGSFHEALSSASVQGFVRSALQTRGVVFRIDSTSTELRRAESFYRRALTIDPGAAEAGVRLGRVLSLLERNAEALTQLPRLDASAPPMLRYYETLFTGAAAEALGRLDEARTAYERAAELYPRAQAPRLALSQLAGRTGDSARAIEAIKNVLSATQEPGLEDDPFWMYYSAAGRDADVLLAQAYQALFAEP
jgi:tetratricopeptide (TPR) repeat protein